MIDHYHKTTQVKMTNGKIAAFLLGDAWTNVVEVVDSWIIDGALQCEKAGAIKRRYFSVVTNWWGIYDLYIQDGQWILSGDLD